MEEHKIQKSELKKACSNCGAELKYKPGTTSISCEYCGHQEAIAVDKNGFEELELQPFYRKWARKSTVRKSPCCIAKIAVPTNMWKKTTNRSIVCIAVNPWL
jgi:LSD1 subclass zinc finger protein